MSTIKFRRYDRLGDEPYIPPAPQVTVDRHPCFECICFCDKSRTCDISKLPSEEDRERDERCRKLAYFVCETLKRGGP